MLMKQSLQDTLVMVQNVHVEDSGGIWKKKTKEKENCQCDKQNHSAATITTNKQQQSKLQSWENSRCPSRFGYFYQVGRELPLDAQAKNNKRKSERTSERAYEGRRGRKNGSVRFHRVGKRGKERDGKGKDACVTKLHEQGPVLFILHTDCS